MQEKAKATEKNRTTIIKEGTKRRKVDANHVEIIGKVEEVFKRVYETEEESFYKTTVSIERKSGIIDYIPIVVSDYVLKNTMLAPSVKGKYVQVHGILASYNIREKQETHVKLHIFVEQIEICDRQDEQESSLYKNKINLVGYICKTPNYRVTPSGKKITDLMISSRRQCGKIDYIPCIAWEEMAVRASRFEYHDCIKLIGRIQSREYIKRATLDAKEGEQKTIYEVSTIDIIRMPN